MVLKPWDQRTRTTAVLQPLVQQNMAKIAGAQVVAFQPPPLPGSQGLPIQFIIGSTDPFSRVNDVAQKFLQDARASGLFIFLDTDLKIDKPQTVVEIDRSKTALLGLKMSDVGSALSAMLGGGYVNYFGLDGRSYKVIPQVQQRYRLNARSVDELLYPDFERGVRAAVHRRAHRHPHRAAVAQSLPAGERCDDPGCDGTGRGTRHRGPVSPGTRGARAAAWLLGGLWRAVAAIRAGVGWLRAHLRLRAGHHLSLARRVVREFPRSVHHPGLGADVDRRRAVLCRAWDSAGRA